MTIRTNAAGVAICSCGSELEVRCTGGCVEPNVVFENAIAAMPKPSGPPHIPLAFPRHKPGDPPRQYPRKVCNWPGGCSADVEPYSGVGQPPKRCSAHKTKRYDRTGQKFGRASA